MNNIKYLVQIKYSSFKKPIYAITTFKNLKIGDYVIVNIKYKKKIAIVTSNIFAINSENKINNDSFIIAKANKEEINAYKNNLMRAQKALKIAKKTAISMKLNINLLFAEYEKNKLTLAYNSIKKSNFQPFIIKLSNELNLTVKLQLINSRDRAKLIDGIGICGRKLCCSTFLNKIENVTIAKAKNQRLSLNIPKLSGLCNKLKCCLAFENETYTNEMKKYPPIGFIFQKNNNTYKVIDFNILSENVKCEGKNEIIYVPLTYFKK